MSGTREKVGSVLFAVLMVTSVFAGVVALGGTAAAVPDNSSVTDNTQSAIFTPSERVQVANLTYNKIGNVTNATIDLAANDGNVTADDIGQVDVELINASGGVINSSSAIYSGNSSSGTPTTIEFGAIGDNVTGVEGVRVYATATGNSENNDVVNASVNLTDANGTSITNDTANHQIIRTNLNSRLTGEVQFQNGNQAGNVNIDVVDTDTGSVAYNDIVTNPDGSWGPIVISPGNYTVVLDDPDYSSYDDYSTNVQLSAGETEKIFTTLDENLYPEDVKVNDVTQFVGQTGTFEVVVTDQNGDRLEDATVNVVSQSGSSEPSITATGDSTSQTTNANGVATFNVTSNQVAISDFTFEAVNLTASDPNPTDTGTATFIQSGEGSIGGQVYNGRTTSTIEDASVWAVLSSQYETNTRQTTFNTTKYDGNLSAIQSDDDNVIWVRLVDNETGGIISNNKYDVRATEETTGNNGTGVRKVEEMNTSDRSQGEGFAVVDTDGDGVYTFNTTRLEPRDYYMQVSVDAWNASDDRVVDNGQEMFMNVTNVTASGAVDGLVTNTSQTDRYNTTYVYSPTANLTLEHTEMLAGISGSNLVDSPGFINNAGVDTSGSDSNGDFLLNRLYTNFSEGRTYVVIGTKTGFSSDFADVKVTDDGRLEFMQSQTQGALYLNPENVEPAQVDIQQIGLRENASASTTNFSDQTDDTHQQVQRDGSTVDVIKVTTMTEDGTKVPANATVELVDNDSSTANDLTGEFVGVEGGSNLSATEDTIQVNTGSDGVAYVLYKVDSNGNTFSTRKTAVLNNDASATDYSNVTFLGVSVFQEASISGITTDNNDNPVSNTYVYVRNIRWGSAGSPSGYSDRITIRPKAGSGLTSSVDEPTDEFVITHQFWNGSAWVDAGSDTVQRSGLGDYRFSPLKFPQISADSPFKLGEASPDNSQFTLKDVPAVATSGPVNPSTQYDVRGVTLASARQDETGNASAQTKPGFTDDANIAFGFTAGADFAFQSGSLDAPANVNEGEAFSVSANVTNLRTGTETRELQFRVDVDGDGLDAGDMLINKSVTLNGGETQTVTFDVPAGATTGINGTFEHGVFIGSSNEGLTGTINISAGTGVVGDYDGDGSVNTGDLQTGIDKWVNGDIDTQTLRDIIDNWVNA